MNNKDLLDVKKVIESHVYFTSLKDLEKKGKKTLKVVKANEIYSLISAAVTKVVSEHSAAIANEEKTRLIEKSKEEFQKLLEDKKEQNRRASLQDKLIANYEQKLAEANREILRLKEREDQGFTQAKEVREKIHAQEEAIGELQGKIHALEQEKEMAKSEALQYRERAEKGLKQAVEEKERLHSQEISLTQFQGKIQALEHEAGALQKEKDSLLLEKERLESLLTSKEELSKTLEHQLHEEKKEIDLLRKRLETEVDEKKEIQKTYATEVTELKASLKDSKIEERLAEDRKQMNANYEAQISALKDELKNVRQSMNFSDNFSSLLSEIKFLKTSLNEMEKDRTAKVDETFFKEQLAPLLNKEEQMNDKIEKLFGEKMEKLSQALSQKISGLSRMEGKVVSAEESEEAAKLVLENLFKEELSMESNLTNIGVKEKTGGGILGNLAKLKALKLSSSQKDKEEEKKK